jgi:hypothetical protein
MAQLHKENGMFMLSWSIKRTKTERFTAELLSFTSVNLLCPLNPAWA